MNKKHEYWTISKLEANIDKIEFPEFQREATLWDLEKKQRLIDSILRGFDISSIYLYENKKGKYDCIDGRQRINAIFSYLGINEDSPELHNEFFLKMENEIYSDKDKFEEIKDIKYKDLPSKWQKKIDSFELNIVFISNIDEDEELNLLFLRLQIATILNAGEKLHAMTGDIRDWIFNDLKNGKYFLGIDIPKRRFAKEQVAAQIVLNAFSKKNDGVFKRSRFMDLQEFFKQYSQISKEDLKIKTVIEKNLNTITKSFGDKLKLIGNRATAVSVYLFVHELIENKKESEIKDFVEFYDALSETLKWQIPLGVKMDPAYHDLLKFQTSIVQAAGEKTALEKRHDFLKDYFYYYKNNDKAIKGDKEYKKNTGKDPKKERV